MNKLIKIIKADSKANQGNSEVILFLAVFRIANALKKAVKEKKAGILLLPFYILSRIVYKLLSTVYLMELPVGTQVGEGFTIHHLKGTVINGETIIGSNVTINHFITVGENIRISDGAVINPQSVIVKGNIGENAIVGAGSVVTKDVAENTIVAGCPAKPIGSTK